MPTIHIPPAIHGRLLRYANEWQGEMSLATALDFLLGEHEGGVCSAPEVPPHVCVSVDRPDTAEAAPIAADVTTQHERALRVPPTPPAGYRPVGSPPWGEP